MGKGKTGTGCLGCLARLVIGCVVFIVIGFIGLVIIGVVADRKAREAAWDEAMRTHQRVQREIARYNDLKEADDFPFLAPYADRERWEADLRESETRIAGAMADFTKEDGPPLSKLVERTVAVQGIVKEINNRIAYLRKARAELPETLHQRTRKLPEARQTADRLEDYIASVKADFPDRAGDIDQVASEQLPPGGLDELLAMSETALAAARTELGKAEAGELVEYVQVDARLEEAARALYKLRETDTALRETLGQLSNSFARRLADMRLDYYLTIGRSSWDNDSDYDTETTHIYPPIRVSPETYDYFVKLDPNQSLASLRYDSNGRRFIADPLVGIKYWNELDLNANQGVPMPDDDGIFWLEDAPVEPYHQYRVINNGLVTKTGWEPVNETTYEELYDYLGMDVVAKPYGYFESERITVATPPGLAFVGMPYYGRWRSGPAGADYWEWNDEYDELFDIDIDVGKKHRYTRTSWENWRRVYRRKMPYFGSSEDDTRIFGTLGAHVRRSPRFSGTHFAQSGGLAASVASVRGAGASRRGRGPGGLGK